MEDSTEPTASKRKYVRAIGPRLRVLLHAVFGLVALLGANSAYLVSITILEKVKGLSYQNYFYQYMFLAHLVLGLILVLPFIIFGIGHIVNAHHRPNRIAVRVGYGLFAVSLILLFSGVALTRLDFFELKNPHLRSGAYWAHVITPVLAVWLYVLHRLAGPKIKWKMGVAWAGAVVGLVGVMVLLHSQDPRVWNVRAPKDGEKYFHPSAARTATGNFIPAKTLMMDDYCQKCHADVHASWQHSAHRLSSFNNPPYLFSVRETRKVALERDGNVQAARWCAGCHDIAPFLSGAFDDPKFDDVNHPTANAGITCTSCHSITAINSTIGNASYTMEEPIHYPFAFSTNGFLQFLNNQLVKAKPEFHKRTFLKDHHKTTEFCSVCHKVSLPFELTQYKDFLRGQNHYDSFLLSGLSGHNARSFYYPKTAEKNCNDCHMPLNPSEDFGAKFFRGTNVLSIHNHLFPSANTALPYLKNQPDIVKKHAEFSKGSLRLDIFGLKDGGAIDSPLIAPLRPKVPELKKGQRYLLEVVLRTLRVGHHFTQGTADSNEVWVDVTALSGGRVVGRSGGLGDSNRVDPWSHFVNVYMLDKNGNRIDRRNAQDIFVPLYNNQIPPGSGQVVHYAFTVPDDLDAPLKFDIKLQYRKFDTTYMQHVYGNQFTNDLPIREVASDQIVFPVEGVQVAVANPESKIDPWQRWNDYGIGLLLKGDKGSEKGELIQAAQAFAQVETLGRPDGPLNLARVYFKEGRLDETVEALQRASKFVDPPAPRWTIAWLTGLVNKQNGFLDKAITDLRSILEDRYPELETRNLDFSIDYEVINELGQTLFERAKAERGEANRPRQTEFLKQAVARFEKTLTIDSENVAAHYNLALIHAQLGDNKKADEHRALHERYRPDDNARDKAVAIHRRKNPAADHAAQAIVIYDLQRPDAPGLRKASPPRPAAAIP